MVREETPFTDRVDIPDKLLTFFGKRNWQLGIYIPQKGDNTLSYESVIGKNAEELPEKLDPARIKDDGYPFTNIGEEDRRNADASASQAIESIYGRDGFGSIERAYMINGYTSPIRVQFKVHGKKTKREVYVKRPDASRIVGKYLYDIISGIPPVKYAFNESVFIEENVPGKLISKSNEKILLRYIDYQEGIVRAAVHAQFLGLPRDVSYGWNRFVDSQLRTMLFDFDLIFQKRDNMKNPLLNPYREDIDLSSDHFIRVASQERLEVARRLSENKRRLREIGKIAGTMVECDGKTLDQRINEYDGSNSLGDYFESQIYELRHRWH